MQINLLCDKLPETGDFNRSIARSRSKKCLIPKLDDFSRYLNWDERHLKIDPKVRYHVTQIKEALLMKERRYKFLNLRGGVESCTIFHDSHAEIEKLGAQQYFTGSIVIISMDDFFDIAVQKCCGADPQNIRELKDYELISYLFMNLALHEYNERLYVNRLKGLDKSFDDYIDSCFKRLVIQEDEDEYEPDETEERMEILSKLYFGVMKASTEILLNCVRVMCDKFDLAIRSQTFSSFVLSPQNPEIEIPGYIDYTDQKVSFRLPVTNLKKWKYTDYLLNK